MKNRLDFTTSSSTIGNMWLSYSDKSLNLRPDYQRNYVWSDAFKNKLIYSLVRNYPIGNITIRKLTREDQSGILSEVVDGQQRLTTIFSFIENQLTVKGQDAKEILEEVINTYNSKDMEDKNIQKLIKKFEKGSKIEVTYDLLPSRTRVFINNYNLSISTINQAKNTEVAEYFRFVQNQERLRAGEIINAFIDSPIDDVLYSTCDVDKLTDVISFNNTRREFNKLFSAVLGLILGKINFGCKDDDIIEFVRNNTGIRMNTELESLAKIIGKELDFIAKLDPNSVNANKRFIKLLMLLVGFNEMNFEKETLKKIHALEKFNNNISAFNSAKKGEVEKVFKNGFSEESIENHRLVALITKGAHNKERVQERIKLLGTILNSDYME